MAGFSPSTYMPVISPAWTAFMISTTVRPFWGSSDWPQNCSNISRTSAFSTDW